MVDLSLKGPDYVHASETEPIASAQLLNLASNFAACMDCSCMGWPQHKRWRREWNVRTTDYGLSQKQHETSRNNIQCWSHLTTCRFPANVAVVVLGLQAHQVAIAVSVHPLEEAGHVATGQTFKFGDQTSCLLIFIESIKVYRNLSTWFFCRTSKDIQLSGSVCTIFAISALCRAHAKIAPVNVEIDTGKPHCRIQKRSRLWLISSQDREHWKESEEAHAAYA